MNFEVLEHPHGDLVTDIVFDYYGKRFATGSADKHIKVWTWDEDAQKWQCDDLQQRAHNDVIYRLSWAHPEFGQLLASCSEDCTVKIWEEQGSCGDASSGGRWVRRAQLTQTHPVRDVKFSYRGMGLVLATACADGYVRVYEARDVFDLTNWDIKVFLSSCSALFSLCYCDCG
jgi:nucleoporin SEH1